MLQSIDWECLWGEGMGMERIMGGYNVKAGMIKGGDVLI